MSLADSLLSAIVRADGDALVMHVGERPYVVVGANTVNISTHGLNLDAMTQLLAQLLPPDSQAQLEEFGAVEHQLPDIATDRFNVVAARGGDDIWIEIRRRRNTTAPEPAQPAVAVAAAVATAEPAVTVAAPAGVIAEPHHVEPAERVAEAEPVALTGPIAPIEPAREGDSVIEWAAAAESAPSHTAPGDDLVPWSLPEEPSYDHADAAPVPISIPEPIAEPVAETIAAPVLAPVDEAAASPAAEPEATPEPITEAISQPPVERVEPLELVEHSEPAEPVEPVATGEPAEPVTRTVRIEVPPRTPAVSHSTDVERLLRIAASRGATALLLQTDSKPYLRVEGDVRPLDGEPVLTRSAVELAIAEISPGTGHDAAGKVEPGEWLKEYADLGRVRCSSFTDHRGPGLMLRLVATRAATAEQLGLSPEVRALATESQGLVIVAGQRSSGKTTLLSALVDLVNRQRAEYVITLERQIQLLHDNKTALISQREVRGSEGEALAAAHAALRERPDVLMLDDLVSAHLVPLVLTAASEGLLVFVSMPAPSTADAVQRFVELASPEMRAAVQNAMAESFRGAVAQTLLKKSGGGLVTAREVLLATAPISRLVAEGQLAQLSQALDAGRKYGMVTFEETLVEYVRTGLVDVREAFRKAPDRDRLLNGLRREGVDTRLVERLV